MSKFQFNVHCEHSANACINAGNINWLSRNRQRNMQQAPTLNIMIIFNNMVRGHKEQQLKFGIVAAIRIIELIYESYRSLQYQTLATTNLVVSATRSAHACVSTLVFKF